MCEGPLPGEAHEAAGIHYVGRQCSDVAVCGVRAAGYEDVPHCPRSPLDLHR
jgi:hypothetical protein